MELLYFLVTDREGRSRVLPVVRHLATNYLWMGSWRKWMGRQGFRVEAVVW